LAQSLHLLNSQELQTKLAEEHGLAAHLVSSGQNDHDCVAEIYRRALARDPSTGEMAEALAYLQPRQADRRAAFEDLVWALVNSKEFLFNH
jgi:thioredoxin-like negative regulator of GroEL